MLRETSLSMVLAGIGLLGVRPAHAAELRSIQLDAMASAERWQLGGQRINYRLGQSALHATAEQPRVGASATLKLDYDFQDSRRYYISAYYLGEPVPGLCEEVSFWLYGAKSGRRLRVSIEDAQGHWFQRHLAAIDWEGWREVRTPVGTGEGWRRLRRRGEVQYPILHPVKFRQISILACKQAPPTGAVYLHDLRARAEVAPADFVTANMATGRAANLFDVTDTPRVQVELTSRAGLPVTGALTAVVTDFSGRERRIDLGKLTIAPGAAVAKSIEYSTSRTGTYSVCLKLQTVDRERLWFHRFAVTRASPSRPADAGALFGCMFNLRGFTQAQMPLVQRLNRDAGIRWARIGFGWGDINPAANVWTSDGPKRVPGLIGNGVKLDGQSIRRPHHSSLDCPDEVTIAFWARGTGPNGAWQTPLQKWGGANRRNYGVYFSLKERRFCFSASYVKHPNRKHCDVSSGFSAWDNKWHHYTATYSRQAKKVVLYVDGRVAVSQDFDGGQMRTNDADLVMGSGFPGGLDEVLLYKRALPPEQVAALARKSQPPRDGLVGRWSFEEGGATVHDSSGNNLHLGGREPWGPSRARLALGCGIKTLGLLGFPPAWASTAPPEAERPWVHKPKLDAWAEFVRNVADRYRDLCQHWEIWNEPNISVFWNPEPDPAEFIDVVKVGYVAAKRANPDCTVITPGLAGPTDRKQRQMDFLDELLRLGAAHYCDAISIHPYRQGTPEETDLAGDLQHISDTAHKHGARRNLWFTENCINTYVPGGSTERRQAIMLPRCYVLSLSTGLMERLIWFRLHDPGLDRFYSEHNYGMCYNDLTPKPAYFAHMTVAKLLDGASPAGQWDVGPKAMARCFQTGPTRVAAVWCPDGNSLLSVYAGAPKVRVVDLMCNEEVVPTTDGVLLIEASETAVFLTGLTENAEGRGAVAEVAHQSFVRGQQSMIAFRVQNPFDTAQSVRVSIADSPALGLAAKVVAADLRARESRDIRVEVSTPSDAVPGLYAFKAGIEFAGRTYALESVSPVRGAAPTAGPVGIWRLDEGTGTRIADSSGRGNHGTIDKPDWVEGKRGRALRFDAGDIAVIPDSPSLNLRDEMTLAFWLKVLGDTGTWQFPVTKFQADLCRNYGIYLRPDTLCPAFSSSFERAGFRHADMGGRTALNDGKWHHLAAAYSMFDKLFRFYVDGKPDGERSIEYGAMRLTTEPLRLGVATKGVIDEVVVYPRALRPEEIAELAR